MMRRLLLLLGLLIVAVPSHATAYFMSASGNDSNNGTSGGTPWLSPNHALNCGDTISAASGTYSTANFQANKWGTVTCAAGNNVAMINCATFDACKLSTSSGDCIRVGASYWGIQGFECTVSSGGGACFTAFPNSSSTSIHHIIFVNDIANGCQSNGFNSFPNGSASVDYLVIIGDIAYNAAQGNGICGSGISVFEPKASDTVAGTHIYIAGNFSYANLDPATCAGGARTDGEGIILDTWNHFPYTQQGVVAYNLVMGNGSHAIEVFNAGSATVNSNHNTMWGDLSGGSPSGTFCGEFQLNGGTAMTENLDLAVTNAQNACPTSNPIYAIYIGNGSASDAVTNTWGYSSFGTNNIANSSGGFSFGGTNTFGTNPSLTSPATPSAPSCGSASSTANCMATVISNFAPGNSSAAKNGYQAGTAGVSGDALFPSWLCNVTLPSGLITQNCGTGVTGSTMVEFKEAPLFH